MKTNSLCRSVLPNKLTMTGHVPQVVIASWPFASASLNEMSQSPLAFYTAPPASCSDSALLLLLFSFETNAAEVHLHREL